MVKVKKFFIFVMSLIPATVFAGFQVVDESAKPPAAAGQPAVAATAQPQPPKTAAGLQLVALFYIGEPDADIPVITGFGRDLKLLEAIKQIAPAGWQAFLKEDLVPRADKFRAVSWKGGRRWVEVLDILANDQNLTVDVDWTKKHLYVGDRKISASIAAQRANPVWLAKTGATLRESVSEWGDKAGWQVVWSADYDYPILAQLTFEGSFIDAIVGVFRSYEKAERPLLVDVHESQKLIVISPRK